MTAVRMPTAVYRVDSGPAPIDWAQWRRRDGVAQTYRNKGHAINRLQHLRNLGYQNPTIHAALLEWRDITEATA